MEIDKSRENVVFQARFSELFRELIGEKESKVESSWVAR
jgi:hypothetical protein